MAVSYGTLSLADTLAVEDADNIFVSEYGEDRLYSYSRSVLDAHNAFMTEMVGDLVEFTNRRISRYGDDYEVEMVEVDEFGYADPQWDSLTGSDVGFPLRAYQANTQWTRLYFENKTLEEFAKQFDAITTGDVKSIEKSIKKALFTPTNSTFIDRRVDKVSLPLKALINADGSTMQRDKFGNAFDGSTHTHYLGTGSFADANLQAAVDTVIEHGVSGNLRIYINRAQEAAVRGFASFDPYEQELVKPAMTAERVIGGVEAYFDVDNRPIGVWDGAIVVWTKPWIPSGYVVVIDLGQDEKPLRFRTRRGAGKGDLRIMAEDEQYPLRCRLVQREYGISVWNRVSAAVLYTGNATYAAPTL